MYYNKDVNIAGNIVCFRAILDRSQIYPPPDCFEQWLPQWYKLHRIFCSIFFARALEMIAVTVNPVLTNHSWFWKTSWEVNILRVELKPGYIIQLFNYWANYMFHFVMLTSQFRGVHYALKTFTQLLVATTFAET